MLQREGEVTKPAQDAPSFRSIGFCSILFRLVSFFGQIVLVYAAFHLDGELGMRRFANYSDKPEQYRGVCRPEVNACLEAGYQFHGKDFSAKRARTLAKSVLTW